MPPQTKGGQELVMIEFADFESRTVAGSLARISENSGGACTHRQVYYAFSYTLP